MSKHSSDQAKRRILIVGVYLASKENLASQITQELSNSSNWSAEQRWVSLGKDGPAQNLVPFTAKAIHQPSPKFSLLNEVLHKVDLTSYEYLIVSDDDIQLPSGFLDRYLALVSQHKFALAQPARTHDSYIDHRFVEQLDGIDARWTRFVEIGPLFSLHRCAFDLFLPFDEASPMGWGNDFVWPIVAEKNHLRMGIVDAVPVAHKLRKPVAYYDYEASRNAMVKYLAERAHLTKKDAFFIRESYA